MSRSSARRAQVEPLAALAAVLVLGVALGAYVGALDGALPGPTDRNRAEPRFHLAHWLRETGALEGDGAPGGPAGPAPAQ